MNWEETNLGEIVEADGGVVQTGPFGSQLKQSEYTDEGIPVIMPKDIRDGGVSIESVARVPEATAHRLSRHRVAPNGIVLPRRGEITKRAFIREQQAGWLCGTGCIKIETNGLRVWPKFLYYFLGAPNTTGWLERNAVGSTMSNLSTEIVSRLPVRLPPLERQREIADLLSAYDDLIENNRRRIELLEESARLLYREWFIHLRFPGYEQVKIADDIPEGWAKRRIGDIANAFRGRSYKSSELAESDGLPFINLKCVERFGGFRISGLKWFVGEHKEHHCIWPGDVVVAVTDMTRDAMIVAQAARVPITVGDNAIYSMDLVKVAPRSEIEPEWFYGMLRFSEFSAVVREEATGATVLHLKPQHIEDWKAVVPPAALRGLFSKQFSYILQQTDNLELQIESCAKARDLLLPRLMNGETTV